MGGAAAVEGIGILRIDRQRLAVVLDRMGMVALVVVGVAAVLERGGEILTGGQAPADEQRATRDDPLGQAAGVAGLEQRLVGLPKGGLADTS